MISSASLRLSNTRISLPAALKGLGSAFKALNFLSDLRQLKAPCVLYSADIFARSSCHSKHNLSIAKDWNIRIVCCGYNLAV